MTAAGDGGLESIELVRVTIYDLPHSHAVWIGWCTMMLGMALIVMAGAEKAVSSNGEEGKWRVEEE